MNENDRFPMGMVTARECPSCGHREIGLTTADGLFHPLRPGMVVRVLEGPNAKQVPRREEESVCGGSVVEGMGREEGFKVWLPPAVKGNRNLRLKYGVLLRQETPGETISPELYRMAYLEKLQRLIEKEIYIPIPVILDRFFTAPHLASGDPKQVAEAMWRELYEVQEPVLAVERWLEHRDPRVFHPTPGEAITEIPSSGDVPAEEDLIKEMESLSLEDFLALL